MTRFLRFFILISAVLVATCHKAEAQHTLGFTAGYGMCSGRFEPQEETRARWGSYTAGISWRYYGAQRIAGGFGIDLEFLQQGFSFVPASYRYEDKKDYKWYNRQVNSIMLPIVWQPHFYMVHNRIRVYLEAAATFSYHLSSSFENEYARDQGVAHWKGDYEFKSVRDNRLGYGLAGGGGVAILIKQFELNFRARYYFGYADVVRSRNKYAGNTLDGAENPFYATPLRSPMDNLTISIGLSYRFNKEGFQTWKPRVKKPKNKEVFKYAL